MIKLKTAAKFISGLLGISTITNCASTKPAEPAKESEEILMDINVVMYGVPPVIKPESKEVEPPKAEIQVEIDGEEVKLSTENGEYKAE